MVAPGTYFENVEITGDGNTLQSEEGPELTILKMVHSPAAVFGAVTRLMWLSTDSQQPTVLERGMTFGIGWPWRDILQRFLHCHQKQHHYRQ